MTNISKAYLLTLKVAFISVYGSLCASPGLLPDTLQPIPDKLVVLTFDDGCKSDIEYVVPLLKSYGFGATFFPCEGYKHRAGWREQNYLTWEEIKKIDDAGFEIGNHTRTHRGVSHLPKEQIHAEIEYIEERCRQYGIPVPKTFCYPGWAYGKQAVEVLRDMGYLFARRGVFPEFPNHKTGARGPVYDPKLDHPLLLPCTGFAGPDWDFDDFVWAVKQARNGKIAILTFHGVPDKDHPWVHTHPPVFKNYMEYLKNNGYTVIAMRDLTEYVDPAPAAAGDPFEPIQRRLKKHRLRVTELQCEYAANPVGVDIQTPRFTWLLESSLRGQMQSACQILVAASEDRLKANIGDLWDSGKVNSDRSVNVAYKGNPLKSAQRCYWKVRCWDKDDNPSRWSHTATFEMGLLKESDWQGKWIGARRSISSPLLRKEFTAGKQVKRARIYISGLGYYELYVNGRKVGDHVLDPATTYYNNDQPFDLGSRVLYVTYDVTGHLHTGRNAIGVMLGNGWYSDDGVSPGRDSFGDRPKLILQMNIQYLDGDTAGISTDDTWRVSHGPVTANEICLGEHYDARLEKAGWNSPGYDDANWDKAVLVQPPSGKLVSQMLPPVKVVKTLKPVNITQFPDGVCIYDFGQHFSGWTRLRVKGPRGAKVTVRHAAAVYDDGTLDTRNQYGAAQTDTYILKGEGVEVWEPRFTLHGFRFAEVTGFPGRPDITNLEGRFVCNSVETTGAFECSNRLLNRIQRNVWWTFMTSLQGIPQDAAERPERIGWLGDTGFLVEDYIYNLDVALFWSKWLDDIRDSQKPNGDIPVISPLHSRRGRYRRWPAWSSTYPLIVWYMYQYYEDDAVLQRHYDSIANLLEFFHTQANNHIISRGLGDHMEPNRVTVWSGVTPKLTPVALTSTAYYYSDVWIMSQAANVLGKLDDYERYSKLAKDIREAFNVKFLDLQTNQYATGSQTSNATALHLGLVPTDREESVLCNLVDNIMTVNEGHLATGIIGTSALEDVLGRYGRADVMYEIATKTSYPSWGYGISRGATTIWERFEGHADLLYRTPPVPGKRRMCCSLNMKMFGSIEKFFYRDLAGIGPAAPGFRRINIKPQVVGDLTYAKASLKTIRGLASSAWDRTANSVDLKVTIPVNCEAKVSVPKLGSSDVTIAESGTAIWKNGELVRRVPGINTAAESPDMVTFDIGSGSYAFRLTRQKATGDNTSLP